MSEERFSLEDLLYELANTLGYDVVRKKPTIESKWEKENRSIEEEIKRLAETNDVKTLVTLIKATKNEIKDLKKLESETEEKIKGQVYEKLAEYEALLKEVYSEFSTFPTLIRYYRDTDYRRHIKVYVSDMRKKIRDLEEELDKLYRALKRRIIEELGVKDVLDIKHGLEITV